MIEGLYLPFSRDIIVCLETDSLSAISFCVIPWIFRNSAILFSMIITSFYWICKVNFTLLYHVTIQMSSLFYIFKRNKQKSAALNNTYICYWFYIKKGRSFCKDTAAVMPMISIAPALFKAMAQFFMVCPVV